MSIVIDYAWGRPGVAALKAAGAVAVCRYLAYPGAQTDGKRLSAAEAAGLTAGGIAVVSNWEQAGSWGEFAGGRANGAAHAVQAQIEHQRCGGPPTRPIYLSVDFDATAAQLPAVGDYFRGVASVIGLERTGAYGGYPTIRYLFDHGLIRWGWQTFAWSGGQWDPRAQLRQVRNGVPIGGVDCDVNESMTADFGQWGTGVADMEQTDKLVRGTSNAPGRTVGDVLTDTDNLRDYLIGAGQVVPGDPAWPKPGSPLGRMVAFLDHPPAPVALSDAQVQQVTAGLAAQLGERLDVATAKLDKILSALAAAGHALES